MQLFLVLLAQFVYSVSLREACTFVRSKTGELVKAGKEGAGQWFQTSKGTFQKCSESTAHNIAYVKANVGDYVEEKYEKVSDSVAKSLKKTGEAVKAKSESAAQKVAYTGANIGDYVEDKYKKVSESVGKSLKKVPKKVLGEKGVEKVVSVAQDAQNFTKKVLQKTGENSYSVWKKAKNSADKYSGAVKEELSFAMIDGKRTLGRAKEDLKTRWYRFRKHGKGGNIAEGTELKTFKDFTTKEEEIKDRIADGWIWDDDEDSNSVELKENSTLEKSTIPKEANQERSIWDEISWTSSSPGDQEISGNFPTSEECKRFRFEDVEPYTYMKMYFACRKDVYEGSKDFDKDWEIQLELLKQEDLKKP